MTITKYQLRKEFTQIRQQIPLRSREQAAMDAAKIMLKQAWFKQAEHIACYLAIKDEFESNKIIEAIWKSKKNCYVPALSDKQEKWLDFVLYDYGTALQKNRYSILEPKQKDNIIPVSELDVVITPMLAFDNKGHRLGTGGGFYDKTFAFLLTPTITKPLFIGLAYSIQETNYIPTDPWDIKMSGVLTESKFLNILDL